MFLLSNVMWLITINCETLCRYGLNYDTYGKFPATIPSIFSLIYVQAQHLDLDFYDRYFKPGAYLTTHKEHMKKWH